MRILFSLLILVFTVALLITGVVYLLARVLTPILSATDSKAWKGLLKSLGEHLNKRYNNLVPWDKDMLALLSLNLQEEKKTGWMNGTASGVFSTIYHEPVLAYAQQGTGYNKVTLARTSNREYVFRHKAKETEIWLNQQPLGLYIDGNLISAGREGKLIGRLERNKDDAAFPVLFGESTTATLSNPQLIHSPNPRALTLYRAVNTEEENTLLALAILNMTGQA